MNIDYLKTILEKHNQTHLLRFYDKLTNKEQDELLNDIASIDFDEFESLKDNVVKSNDFNDVAPFNNVLEIEKVSSENKKKYAELSNEAIKNGELAICVMAGGQGSRLGHTGPKGTFMVDFGDGVQKSIFELCTTNIMKAHEKYGVFPYCFIMTSTLNHDETIEYFEKKNYFGYDKSKMKFFIQGKMPLTDLEGNIVLESESHVYLAPNGNGGIFKALQDEKILNIMEENSIKYLYITNVDNIITNPYEETILGSLIDGKVELGVKTLIKSDPNEKVGVCCEKDGKFLIVEYIDLPKELCEKTLEDESLLFKDSYFGTCYLSLDLLKRIANEKLPYHQAKKKNRNIGKDGNIDEADEINSIKYEMFIFDGFYKANSVKLYRVKRENEFAPIKGREDIEEAVRLYKNNS